MILRTLIIILTGSILAVVQSTFLGDIIPFGFVPDLALLMLIAVSWRYGSMVGQVSGFVIGLSFDALSLSPLGFHALVLTLTGYIFGRLHDTVSPGPVFFPAAGAAAATVFKYAGAFLLAVLFGLNSSAVRYFSLGTLWETLANVALAPFVFLLVRLVGDAVDGRRGGFH